MAGCRRRPVPPEQRVVTGGVGQVVLTRATVQCILTRSGGQAVIAGTAAQFICRTFLATNAEEDVVVASLSSGILPDNSGISVGSAPSLATPETGSDGATSVAGIGSPAAAPNTPDRPQAPTVLLADDTGIRVLQSFE